MPTLGGTSSQSDATISLPSNINPLWLPCHQGYHKQLLCLDFNFKGWVYFIFATFTGHCWWYLEEKCCWFTDCKLKFWKPQSRRISNHWAKGSRRRGFVKERQGDNMIVFFLAYRYWWGIVWQNLREQNKFASVLNTQRTAALGWENSLAGAPVPPTLLYLYTSFCLAPSLADYMLSKADFLLTRGKMGCDG